MVRANLILGRTQRERMHMVFPQLLSMLVATALKSVFILKVLCGSAYQSCQPPVCVLHIQAMFLRILQRFCVPLNFRQST